MNKNSTKVLVALFFSSFFGLKAQQNLKHDDHNHNLSIEQKLNSIQQVFDFDSLRGFHEEAAWQQAKICVNVSSFSNRNLNFLLPLWSPSHFCLLPCCLFMKSS